MSRPPGDLCPYCEGDLYWSRYYHDWWCTKCQEFTINFPSKPEDRNERAKPIPPRD